MNVICVITPLNSYINRAKYHKLKYGTELQQGDVKPPIFEDGGGVGGGEPVDGESIFVTNSNVNWRQGRQLLRQ